MNINPQVFSISILIIFLIMNLLSGIDASKNITTLKEYALGGRNFTTFFLISTIIATWVGGSFFFTIISESYKNGLYYLWSSTLAKLVYFLLIVAIFAPRVSEFIGKLSIAEAMGSIYGEKVRVITAISGIICSSGIIAVQLKVAGIIFEYTIGLPEVYGIIITAVIVTAYSILGGIKRIITLTNFIQLFTFAIIFPIITIYLLKSFGISGSFITFVKSNPLFDLDKIFDFSQMKSLYFLFLFIYLSIPSFSPAMFQRISMTKNSSQVMKAFAAGGLVCFLLSFLIGFIGILISFKYPDINSNDVVKTFISCFADIPGFNGLFLVIILSMIMYTVDSFINSTSVMIVHDFLGPLKIRMLKNQVSSARLATAVIGIVAAALSFWHGNTLELMILSYSFYMPIVTAPFMMATFGFRSTSFSAILSMIAGFITVVLWMFLDIDIIYVVIPGMCANLVVLILSHYLFRQKGGWVGIKDVAPLITVRNIKNKIIKQFLLNIKKFDFLEACKVNYPGGDGLIAILGVYLMFVTSSSYSNTVKLDLPDTIGYAYAFKKLYPIALCSSTCLITYPLWLPIWRATRAVGIVWNLVAFYSLICFSWLMVVISNFSQTPLLIFMANVIIIFLLVRWQWTLLTVSIGMTIVTFAYTNLIAVNVPDFFILKSKLLYFVVVSAAIIALFSRKKQEYHRIEDQKLTHWRNQFFEKQKLYENSIMLQYKSTMLSSELQDLAKNTVDKMYNILYRESDNHIEERLREKIRQLITRSYNIMLIKSNCLIAYFDLTIRIFKLRIEEINFSDLVKEILEQNKILYLGEKPIKLITDLKPNITIECDKLYITKILDCLISNCMTHSKNGTISISSNEANSMLEFTIKDEGESIPKEEIPHTFDKFLINSKLRTRGIEFYLTKRVIELLKGEISVENNDNAGVVFKFSIPLKQEKKEIIINSRCYPL